MKEQDRTKEQLINELVELRQRIAELEKSEAERKRAEEVLKESEAKYKSLFEGSHDAILLADPGTGRFVGCNRKAEELSGYSRDEILSMKIGQFTPEDIKGETAEEFQKLIAGKGIQKEWEILTKGGNRMPVEISTTLIRVGNKSYLQGIVRDITERKRAERTLRESEERFRSSVETMLEGFAIFSGVRDDAGHIIDFRYDYINEAGCKINQRTCEEQIGHNLLELLPKYKDMGLFDEYVRVVETGQSLTIESLFYEGVYGGGKKLAQAIDLRAVKLGDGFATTWRDVTQRKHAEEELRQSEERLRLLVESSKDMIFMQDLEGKYLYYNSAPEHSLSVDNMEDKTPFDFFKPETAARLMNQLKQVAASGKAMTFENHVVWKGEALWLLDHRYPIRDAKGHVVAIGTVARNITERKRVEEVLRRSEANYRELADSITDVFFAFDKDLRYTYWNKASEELTGIPARDAIGKFLYELFPDTTVTKRAERVYLDVLRTQQPQSFVNEYQHGGKNYFFEISVYPSMSGLSVFVKDITERNQMEEVLQLTRFSLDNVADTMVCVDHDGRFIDVNDAFCRSVGYSREELRSMSVHDIDPNYPTEVWPEFWEKLKQGGSLTFESCHRTKEGKVFPVEITANFLEYNGKEYHCSFARDITERKRVEEALRESEARYRIITDGVHDIIWQLDLRLHFVYVSPAVERVLGYTPQEACGLYVADLLDEDGFVQMREIIQNRSERKTDFSIPNEYRMRHKNGHWVDVEILSSTLFDAEGHPTGFAGITRDIGERKRVEEALRRKSGEQTLLLDNIQTQVWYLTDEETYGTVNKARAEFFGKKNEEMENKKLYDVLSKDEAEICTAGYVEVFEKRKQIHTEEWIANAKGEKCLLSIIKSPKLDESGDVEYVVCSAEDITERKRIEEAFRKSEVLHKEAQKTAHIGHWELDTSMMVPTWSEEIFRIFGLDPQKEPPSFAAHQKVTHPDDWNILNNAMTRSINEGIPFDVDFRILRPDKTIRWMHAIGYPKKDSQGRIVSVFGTAQDVTESKQAEDQLRNSQEQLRALSAHLQFIREEERTLMAREIHDELGQELTGLKMDLSWLVKGLSKNQKSLISKTETMLKLVDSTIQTVRKISSELRPGVLDDLGLIAAIEWQTQDFENRTGITCVFSSSVEEIDLDRDRSTAAFRIFQETMTNVSRHANATRVRINLEESGHSLILRIEDNGRGIKESEVSHPKSLGLVGMRERVLLFGGEVIIRGIAGEGTTVAVTIPIKKE